MKRIGILICVLFIISCAKLSVETAKPIKVDINMRVDIYQHVIKDVEDINAQIYGTEDKDFNALFGFNQAYAEDLSDLTASAISRRKARVSIVEGYFAQGYIGENKDALLELRNAPEEERGQIESLISQENSDRNIIYQAIAEKNGTDISTVRKASLESDYKRAGSGYWFQVSDSEGYTWNKK
ncbi:MAG: DUF1318 domain-containing protein [Candidatus Omnitrophota bacterium]